MYLENIQDILKFKKKLEEKLKVKISIDNNEVSIEGKPEDEFYATKVVEAINMGFQFKIAMLIKYEDFDFQIIPIKANTTRKDIMRIKGRIIGTGGKTLKTLSHLTKCFFEIKDNNIGVIGNPEYMENAHAAVVSIIKGTKQGNVYSYLEKHQVEPVIDLGLKVKKKRRKTNKQ